jgi:hypothetical protein
MKRIDKLSLTVIIISLFVAVVGVACQYNCDFCGSYQLETDPSQWIAFQRDGRFQWVTTLAQASGNWYADGGKITVPINWGTFTGRIEGRKFIDSGGIVWVRTTEYRSCTLCCNVPRPVVNLTETPTPTQTPISINYFNLGDVATSSSLRIAVISAEKMTQYHLEATMNAPSNTFFIIVNVEVLNLGSSTIATDASLFNLRDKSGSIYQPVRLSVLASNQFPWYAQALAPGQPVSGRILYIVSNQSSDLSVVTFVNGQYLAWVLPW